VIRDQSVARETALLFHCARGVPDGIAIRDLVDQGIDWNAFLALAGTHGLTSLCGRRLEQVCPDSIPAGALDALRRHFRLDSERNLFLTGELFRIRDRLAAEGIQALALKGPVLGWWLYGHPGLRRFHDLDLLVEQAELDRAVQLFSELGYYGEVGRNGRLKIVPSGGQISLFRKAPRAEVDLHWNLAPRAMGLGLDARSLMPRAMAVQVGGRSVQTFGLEDQLLLCTFHGGKHGWTNLAWLADLSALIETRTPDWPRLLAEARRKQLSRALFLGLRLVHELLGTPLPAEIRKPLQRDSAAAAIVAETRAFLLNGPARRAILPRELCYEWQLTEGWPRKTAYLWHKITAPSPEDWELPKSTRPFRLVRKYAYRLAGLG
jgi:hypothetical protein